MKNKIKKILMILSIASVLFAPLQLVCHATSASFDNDISAIAKKTTSKKELGLRFLVAMFGVAASSIVIYVGLSVYNKFLNNTPNSNIVGLNSLVKKKKSNDYKDSLKIFIKKTDWD